MPNRSGHNGPGLTGTRRRPRVVRTRDVGDALLRIDLQLRERPAREGVAADLAHGVGAPHLGRIVEILGAAVGERKARAEWQHATFPVAEA